MKLSTGKVAFLIEFDNGDKETIYFNPNDPDLMIRIKNFGDNVQKKIEGLEDVELTNEGKPVEFAKVEIFEQMQKIIKDELDYVFSGEVSKVVFKHLSPFAIVNGEYFIEQFIRKITPEIGKEIKKSRIDADKRMAKHIGKYTK